MKRALPALLSLVYLSTFAIASKQEFNPCFQKNSLSIYSLSGIQCLAVTKNELVCHDPLGTMGALPAGYTVLNFDPFTRIYEIRTPETLNPVVFKGLSKIASGSELALIDKNGYTMGSVESYSNGIDAFGKFSQRDTLGKVIGAKCYTVVGLGSIDGRYIPSEFIQSFIEKKDSIYGDIGVRLEKRKNAFVVSKRDVFFPDNPFEMGDEIITINGKRYERFDGLSFAILFAKPGTLFTVSVKRNGAYKTFKVRSGVRYGGGYMTDTFLERFGLHFDTDLKVLEVTEGSYAAKAGMKAGDRLLQYDGESIDSIDELTLLLSAKREPYSSILFERKNFQFFFTIH